MSGWTTLVPAETLALALGRGDLAILDCRFDLAQPDAGQVAYRAGHLPGARYAHLERDLSAPLAPGGVGGRHPWPREADFQNTIQGWGIHPGVQVVVYDDGAGAIAARLWWLLRQWGHARVAVLDGGWARWTALGLPVQTALPAAAHGYCPGRFDRDMLLDADGVIAHLAAGGILLDARVPERFVGDVEPIDRVAGHVPGARNRPFTANLESGRFKPSVRLAAEYRALLNGCDVRDVVVMCGSGVTACHLLLALERAGMPGARLYAGSWSDWVSDRQRPVVTGAAAGSVSGGG